MPWLAKQHFDFDFLCNSLERRLHLTAGMHYKRLKLTAIMFIMAVTFSFGAGCNVVKKESKTPTLLKNEIAGREQLMAEVNRFAAVSSLRAKMDLKFEDNSFAQFGSKEIYRSADGEIVVQRPAKIYLKVQVPIIKTDVAQMTSDGEKFRVAILQDGGSGKYRKFVIGSNNADYSKLQKSLELGNGESTGEVKKNVSAFANLRPQHFTDAMLVQPTDQANIYTQTTIFQVEEDETQPAKSPLRKVLRGYYLLDEYKRNADGELIIKRRFWFDRVGGIRLARQQIFDTKGEIESDIVYGREGDLAANGEYKRLPLEIIVTRPKEKYSMRLTYQSPQSVTIGKTYPPAAFVLENSWDLEVVDLDQKLSEVTAQNPLQKTAGPAASKVH
jgi:hypothetical protein